MTGIICAMAGSGSGANTMTVGSSSYVVKATVYVDGYISATSQAAVLAPAIGNLTPGLFNGIFVAALYATSNTGHASGATCYIEVAGSRGAGFISSVKVNGVAIGTIGSPSYSGSTDTTQYQVGSAGITNPFGTSGTKLIEIA